MSNSRERESKSICVLWLVIACLAVIACLNPMYILADRIADRFREPVVIRLHQELFGEFEGDDIGTLEVWRYSNETWDLIPFQIDEVTNGLVDVKDYYGYDQPGNSCNGIVVVPPGIGSWDGPCEFEYEAISRFPSTGFGIVSDNDELVFLAYHTDSCDAPLDSWPDGVLPVRYRIDVSDNNFAEKGCVYLFSRASGVPPAMDDLVSYSPIGDGIPETCRPAPDACGAITSSGDLNGDFNADVPPYRIDFYGNWTISGWQIGEVDFDGNQDLVDICKWRIESPLETEQVWDLYQPDDGFCAVWIGYIDGPVRVIRVIQAAASGGMTRKYEYAYPGEMVTQVFVRVHDVTGPFYNYADINRSTTTKNGEDEARVYKEGYTVSHYDKVGDAVSPPACNPTDPPSCYRPHEWYSLSTPIGSFLRYQRIKTGDDVSPDVDSSYIDSNSNTWPAGREDEHAPEWDIEHEDHVAALTKIRNLADSQNPRCILGEDDPLIDRITPVIQLTDVMLSAGHSSGTVAAAEFARRDRGVFGVCAAKETATPPAGGNGCVPQLHVEYTNDGEGVDLTPQVNVECVLVAWNLYRQVGAGIWKRIATTPGVLTFREATLALGEQATYAASGYGSDCVESEHSQPVTILYNDIAAPEPPQNPEAEAGVGEVIVRWNRPSDPDINGYKVLVASSQSGPFTQVHVGIIDEMTTTYTFSAASGQTYFVGVVAVDHAGNESEMSLPVEVLIP